MAPGTLFLGSLTQGTALGEKATAIPDILPPKPSIKSTLTVSSPVATGGWGASLLETPLPPALMAHSRKRGVGSGHPILVPQPPQRAFARQVGILGLVIVLQVLRHREALEPQV